MKPTMPDVLDTLKQAVDLDTYVDVGKGANKLIGCSETMLQNALHILEQTGYYVYRVKRMQLGTNKIATAKVLVRETISWPAVKEADLKGRISSLGNHVA